MAELYQVVISGGEFLLALLVLLQTVFTQNWALLLWIGFWLFLVRWEDLRPHLSSGGWVSLLLLYVLISLVWGLTTDPYWSYFGVTFASVLEKFGLTFVLFVIAFICGWLQDSWRVSPGEVEIPGPPDGQPASHGHDDHH